MERFERFRFSVLAVPLRRGVFVCFNTVSQRGRFRFRFRFLENGSGGSGSAFGSCESGSDGSGFRFRFPVPVRFLGHSVKEVSKRMVFKLVSSLNVLNFELGILVPVYFGARLGVSLAAPTGVSKRMGFKMESFSEF